MNKNTILKILIFSLVLILFTPLLIKACTIGETSTPNCGSYTKCKCESNNICGDDVLKKTCEKKKNCDCIDDGTGNGIWDCGSCNNTNDCGASSQKIGCETWELCNGSTGWTSACGQGCVCEGDCLADPVKEGSVAYPNSGIQDGNDFVDSNNVFLPSLFDWKKVGGANSYWWKATPSSPSTNTQNVFSPVIQEPSNEYTPGPCFLQSANSYSWKVRPCCSNDGLTECRTWDSLPSWSFIVNLAPEPATPTDPDWNNEADRKEDVEIPVTLDWCAPPDNQDYLGMGDTDPDNPIPLFQDEYDYEEGMGKYVESYKINLYSVDIFGNETCHPWLGDGAGGCRSLEITKTGGSLSSSFEDSLSLPFFIGSNKYRWEVSICFVKQTGEKICSDFGQKWEFKAEDTPILDFELLSPPNDPLGSNAVGLPVPLTWEKKLGSNSFICKINPGGIAKVISPSASGSSFDFPELSLNSLYNWKVTPCHDFEGNDCDTSKDSDLWWFKTTGAPPNLNEPINNPPSDVIIPADFDWDDVSGAGSYRIQIQDVLSGTVAKEAVITNSEISVDYPDLKMGIDYQWKVQTCAHLDGSACGNWSGTRAFKTFELGIPPNRSPIDGASFKEAIAITLSWDSVLGAKAYQYIIYDPSGNELFNEITSFNSLSFNSFDFPEIGVHEWKIQACLIEDCSVNGGWSNLWSFDVDLEAPPGERGGLVPCGRDYDDPNTPFPMDERESCQIKHLFLLLRNILDFALWKIGTAMLVLISIIFGALFYFSRGDQGTILKIKSFARSVVIGYALIFGAWLFINLLLAVLGFNFQFFGHWWEIKF